MKKWVEKLVSQFEFEWSEGAPENGKQPAMSDDRATLLYIIDTVNKHLIEVEGHPVRRVREILDQFAKDVISPKEKIENTLFRFRQFFSAYRIDETTYFQKTFEELRQIVWNLVDQLAEDLGEDQKEDFEVRQSLDELKEAVESNSIEMLKSQSRKFIDVYIDKQIKKDKRRSSRMKSIRKNLKKVTAQLGETAAAASTDHLTGASNRKVFDETCEHYRKLMAATPEQPVSLLLVDIDHFKRINDTYGHAVGDFILKELVGMLKTVFSREADSVSRIGGEEFAILLPELSASQAMKKAEEIMARVRGEVFVHEEHQIRFTVSIGISQLGPSEDSASWIKRADLALYHSKNTGRNRATLAPGALKAA